jgi:hypothetical protein
MRGNPYLRRPLPGYQFYGIDGKSIELSKPINNAQIREAFMKDDQRWSSFAFTHKNAEFLHRV